MKYILIVIALYMLLSSSILSKTNNNYELYRKHFTSGLSLNKENSYLGAKDLYPFILPIPYIDLENESFKIRGDLGILKRVHHNKHNTTYVGIYYYIPRTKDMTEKEVLYGIHKVKFDLPIVIQNSTHLFKSFELMLRIEQGVINLNSQKYIAALTTYNRLLNSLFLEASIGYTMANKGYINNYFGISNKELMNNNYFKNTYYAKNNYFNSLSIYTEAYLYYDITNNFASIVGAKYSKLTGNITKSPIIEDRNQCFYMLSFVYKFY